MNCAGIENRLMDIYRNIDRKRVQFDFYTFRVNPGYFDEEISLLGGCVFYSEPYNIFNTRSITHRIFTFLKAHPEYKIVHVHLNAWSGIVLRGARKAGVPIRIAHSRTALNHLGWKQAIKNILKLSVNKNVTHRFAVSLSAAYWLFGKDAVKRGLVQVWPNSIDCEKFKYDGEARNRLRKELNLDDSFCLIHVGNMSPIKNQMFLIDVFDRLNRVLRNSKLLIIGSDFMSSKVQVYATSKPSSDDILFLGTRTDVNKLLSVGDVFILTSYSEGFPGSALEAQAAGLPCVISNTITPEICLTSNVVQLPIDKGTETWVDHILDFINVKRTDNANTLYDKGYDVFGLCERLTTFYEDSFLRA